MSVDAREYRKALIEAGKSLGLRGVVTEDRVVDHCLHQMDQMLIGQSPVILSDLLPIITVKLNLSIEEVGSQEDIRKLLQRIPPDVEPVMAKIPLEMTDETHAIVVRRLNHKAWERPYLAVINCMGEHFFRRYFSKWHEIAHLFIEGKQMTFAFRRTVESEKHKASERLVDRVAAKLAFYPRIFKPVLRRFVTEENGLTFEGIEKIKMELAPEASQQASTIACIRESDHPILWARFKMGLRKGEEENMKYPDLFPETITPPTAKLRLKELVSNVAAQKMGLKLHLNQSISSSGIIGKVFVDGGYIKGEEDLSEWFGATSSLTFSVEAKKVKDEVVCLIQRVQKASKPSHPPRKSGRQASIRTVGR